MALCQVRKPYPVILMVMPPTQRLGNAVSFSDGFMGNMDGVRYIKGIARYFGDFTPDVTIPLAIAK